MKNFYFRLNSDEKMGLGHLMRCLRLARVLKSKGHTCIFCLDKKTFLHVIKSEFKIINLYKKNQKFKDENADAKLFLKLTKASNEFIVVDDYRLNYLWQKKTSKEKNKIIVLDDFENKSNYCDYYINSKPNFIEKKNFSNNILKKKSTTILLGPRYSMIYCKSKRITKKNIFSIGFYLGGSGNFDKIYKILKDLIIKQKITKQKIQLIIIPGIYSKGLEKIKNISKKNDIIKVLNPSLDLNRVLSSLDLLVSTAGTIIYESAYHKIPTLIFEVSKNQDNKIKFMEMIGHYFVLSANDLTYSKKISDLIYLMYEKNDKIKKLQNTKKINIDNNGALRIVESIFQKKSLFEKKEYSNKVLKNKNNSGYQIKKVVDRDLNDYLDARNLPSNREASTKNKKIKHLDHYIWWLKNNRTSFSLIRDNEKILYLYEEILFFDNKRYSIQGWFKASTKITLFDILYALKWQKKKLENKKIYLSLGIIKEDNPINLSKYLGWKKLDNQHIAVSKLKKFYGINNDEYKFYAR